ncbi:MAG: hypothetical protein QNK23_14330 [Crocinitomicaceae bacterium]|nr:hypothetical protein [Crocinitomicaceae bacterium]
MMKHTLYMFFVIISAVSTAQEVVHTTVSDCDKKSYPEYIRNRLIEKELKEDTLFLNVGLVLNCCLSPMPKLIYRDDTLFLEIIDSSDIRCACVCCFEIQVKAIGIPDTNFTLIHQYEASDITNEGFIDWTEYKMLKKYKNKYIFPSPEELDNISEYDQISSSGSKIGAWNIYYDNSEKVKYKVFYFIDVEGESKIAWSIRYDEEGEISEICGRTGENESTCAEGIQYNKLMGGHENQ